MSVGQFRRLRARMADRVLSLRPVHSVVLVMALVAGTHLLLSLLPISSHHPSQTELLTGIAYFVLSILLGFTLENVRSGQARVNELLKSAAGGFADRGCGKSCSGAVPRGALGVTMVLSRRRRFDCSAGLPVSQRGAEGHHGNRGLLLRARGSESVSPQSSP